MKGLIRCDNCENDATICLQLMGKKIWLFTIPGKRVYFCEKHLRDWAQAHVIWYNSHFRIRV